MPAKRALVVDDSKSARAFLHRLLDKHGLEVSTAESAEEALESLKGPLPDVIFMDHLMPGMDGFQAVQAIKAEPRTAGIPVMMYTSQQGDLYHAQARALGAVGVLSKQIQPADVTKILYQLNLIPDRRGDGGEPYTGPERRRQEKPPSRIVPLDATAVLAQLETPMFASRATGPVPPQSPGTHRSPPSPAPVPFTLSPAGLDLALKDLRLELEDMRRQLDGVKEQQSTRFAEELAKARRELTLTTPPAAPEPVAQPSAASGGARDWLGLLYAVAATAAAVTLGILYFQGEVERRALEIELARMRDLATQEVDGPSAAPAEWVAPAGPGSGAKGPAAAGAGAVWDVPFGELPLAGERVTRLQELLARLSAEGFAGVVEVQAFPGRYCLRGSLQAGYALAPETLPLNQCDLIGNATDTIPGAPPRESLAFADMLAGFRQTNGGRIEVKLSVGSADQVVRPYPETVPGTTVQAAGWNAAAAANNRVEVRWFPTG